MLPLVRYRICTVQLENIVQNFDREQSTAQPPMTFPRLNSSAKASFGRSTQLVPGFTERVFTESCIEGQSFHLPTQLKDAHRSTTALGSTRGKIFGPRDTATHMCAAHPRRPSHSECQIQSSMWFRIPVRGSSSGSRFFSALLSSSWPKVSIMTLATAKPNQARPKLRNFSIPSSARSPQAPSPDFLSLGPRRIPSSPDEVQRSSP